MVLFSVSFRWIGHESLSEQIADALQGSGDRPVPKRAAPSRYGERMVSVSVRLCEMYGATPNDVAAAMTRVVVEAGQLASDCRAVDPDPTFDLVVLASLEEGEITGLALSAEEVAHLAAAHIGIVIDAHAFEADE